MPLFAPQQIREYGEAVEVGTRAEFEEVSETNQLSRNAMVHCVVTAVSRRASVIVVGRCPCVSSVARLFLRCPYCQMYDKRSEVCAHRVTRPLGVTHTQRRYAKFDAGLVASR